VICRIDVIRDKEVDLTLTLPKMESENKVESFWRRKKVKIFYGREPDSGNEKREYCI
jgi:hypothetical protein